MFAFGVMLFRLISKERPFASDNFEILKKQTIELRYNVQSGDWGNVSVAAKDLIRKLLIGRRQRVTAQQALSHRWFQELGLSVLPSGHSTVCGLHEGDGRSEALIRVHTHLFCIFVEYFLSSTDFSRFPHTKFIVRFISIFFAVTSSRNSYTYA